MASHPGHPGGSGVRYASVADDYFEKRQLQRHAGFFTLWMLGVGAVIAGEYSGWNLGLASGGFGGMAVALLLIAVMYLCLCFSIAEMSAALPHTGGAYSFSRSALGPWGGYTTGLAENIEFILAPAANVFFMASYLSAIFETPDALQPLWWIASYVVMLLLSFGGLALSMRVVVGVTIAAIAILVAFFVAAVPHVDLARFALNIGAGPEGQAVLLPDGGGSLLPFGWQGAMLCLPFAVYMFLAIEQLPLTAEESHSPVRDVPRALIAGIVTLVVLALGVLFFNASVPPGAFAIGQSGEPLLDGLRAILGDQVGKVLAAIAVVGLAASFLAGSFAAGRNIYSLSRAGYFPTALSVTHPRRGTPNRALLAGSLLGLAVLMLMWFAFGGAKAAGRIGGTLVNMVVFAAMISYMLQSWSFLRLRTAMPHIERPFRSPFGRAGAHLTIVLALVTLTYQFLDPAYRAGVIGAAIWYALGMAYFIVHRRQRLVLSPEEAFAVERRRGTGAGH